MIRLAVTPLFKKAVASASSRRGLATRKKVKASNLSPEVWNALSNFPEYDNEEPLKDPAVYKRGPVTSTHMVDVTNQTISTIDSATITSNGSVVHGSLGDLGKEAAATIPLEYLALLRPASEGAAAIRTLTSKSGDKKKGTILIYGASQPNGFAATQLASSAGHAVVAVVGSEHSGNEDCMEAIKGLITEPGTAVPEEYALCKKLFLDLVNDIATGNEGIASSSPSSSSPNEYLSDFKKLFLEYVQVYPDTRPAAVDASIMEFKYMEKDRDTWDLNMQAYLSQFPPGSPPVDKAKLDAFFTTEQYQIFRDKFWYQTTAIISGDDHLKTFSAPHLVKQQSEHPETMSHTSYPGAGPFVPYSFNILKQVFPMDTAVPAGGPILGAAIAVTPDLKIACEKVASAGKTKRAKGEALSFLTKNQRATLAAAASVAEAARRAKAPVVIMGGSLPNAETVQPTKVDVDEALKAMDVNDNGESRLNYFVQLYRASDYPFYADYAVHRASEELAGPRQIIVAK